MYVYWCRLQSKGLTYSACWAQNKLSPQIYEHKNKYETRYCQSLNKMTISSTLLHHVMTPSAISPRQSVVQSPPCLARSEIWPKQGQADGTK